MGVYFFVVVPLLCFCLRTIHEECDVDISIPDDCDYATESLARRRWIIGILWSSGMCLFMLHRRDTLFVSLLFSF